jgi:hypothetical protein
MKARFTYFVLLLFFISINGLHAQNGTFGGSVLPLQPNGSPLFGKDIVIMDSSSQNQSRVVICSAFNGWLYAAYEYFNPLYGGREAFAVLKSIDNGITWNVILDSPSNSSAPFSSFDIVATGDSVSNIKVFLEWVSPGGPIGYDGDGELVRLDGNGNYLDGIVLTASYLALATDFMYPASNSSPYSIGILYAASNYNPSNYKDSLILLSSSNGGMSYNNKQLIALSSNHFHNVALAYGRSPSWNSGRYFAAWTETNDVTTYTGNIQTAHSNPDFNSPFTKPVCIDSLDPSAINKVRNPKIACQFSSSDNDSSNLTEVIMLEKQLSTNNYDTRGFYNLQATTSNHFGEFSLTSSSNNKIQPNISFNPYNSSFMLTYFDSTEKKLPFLVNDVNLTDPNSWNVISQAYNDNNNLIAPYPKVKLNMEKEDGMNVWISEGAGSNGIAMFDAPYSTWTGVPADKTNYGTRLIGAYPNPCSTNTTIRFELQKAEKVNISICNLVGQALGTLTDQSYPAGNHELKCNISNLSPGSYIVKLMAGDFQTTGKLTVIR